MKEIDKLRREIKADLALTHGLQCDMTKRLETTEVQLAEMQGSMGNMQGTISHMQGTIGHLQETVGHLQESVGQLQGEVGQLKGEVGQLKSNVTQLQVGAKATTEVSRKIEGSLRKTGERFDKILRVISEEFAPMTELVNLEARFEARMADIERRLSA